MYECYYIRRWSNIVQMLYKHFVFAGYNSLSVYKSMQHFYIYFFSFRD